MGEKRCTKCEQTKPLSEFYKYRDSKDGYSWRCKSCDYTHRKEYTRKNRDEIRAHRAEYRKKNRERILAGQRKRYDPLRERGYKLKANYGMTLAEYDAISAAQKGLCLICGNPERRIGCNGEAEGLAVDHEHETGKVRGLICTFCNAALGMVEESIETLGNMIRYLRDPTILKARS